MSGKTRGHHACLGDIAQNTNKMGVFKGSLGRVLQELA